MDAFLFDCVRAQVDSFLTEITRVEGGEFPYEHSADCLRETKDLFIGHQQLLACIDSTVEPRLATFECEAALNDIEKCLPLLGFLLRSTNVRNAFEAYGPLLRMAAHALANPDAKLVISSEWSYVPFTYVGFHHLPGAVLIGLPATESSNPLLLPLSGHELGHNVWRSFSLENDFAQSVKTTILTEIRAKWSAYGHYMPNVRPEEIETELMAHSFWAVSYAWALRQCEEHFCDAYGVRLFGESYTYAFAYLLAPLRTSRRAPHYPGLIDRARAIVQVCSNWNVAIQQNYPDLFEELDAFKQEEEKETAQLELAEKATRSVLHEILSKVGELLIGIPNSEDQILANIERFRLSVPAANAGGIAHLLNAAWRARLNPQLIGVNEMDEGNRAKLAEIVWKSIEIDEIEFRIA